MKCKAYFYASERNNELSYGNTRFGQFREKSTWVPRDVDPIVEVCLKGLEDRIPSLSEVGKSYGNLTMEEGKALRKLKSYTDIVIKEVDKGPAVVIWSRKDYCREVYAQLGEEVVYESIDNICLDEVTDLISQYLDLLVKRIY